MSASPPQVIAISCREILPRGLNLLDWAKLVLDAGVDAILLREKDLPDKAFLHLCTEISTFASSKLIISYRFYLVRFIKVLGVHLPENYLDPLTVRDIIPREVLVGRSVHDVENINKIAKAADYILLSPVFNTPKPYKITPLGVEFLKRASKKYRYTIALGGISLDNIEEVKNTGCWGIAGISAFIDPDIAKKMVERWKEAG